MTEGQLHATLGAVDPKSLLLVVGHHAGEAQRIPWMGLVRVADVDGWAVDPRPDGVGPPRLGSPR
jgi:hypothetical protein